MICSVCVCLPSFDCCHVPHCDGFAVRQEPVWVDVLTLTMMSDYNGSFALSSRHMVCLLCL